MPRNGAFRRILWLLLVALAVAASACQPDGEEAADPDPRVGELEEENRLLREEVARLDHEVAVASAVGEARVQPLPLGTLEGVEDALRVYLPERDLPGRPGVTRWRASGVSLPDDLTDPQQGTPSHGLLALRLLDAVVDADGLGGTDSEPFSFPWEVTTRVLQTAQDQAVVVVQLWGSMGDDSVAGTDYMFELRLGRPGWIVNAASERDQCVRSGGRPGDPDLPALCT